MLMDLNLKNITFIIVCFKSENVIYKCLNSLPKNSNKIIIENSNNIKLKKDLETNYDNIEVIMNENNGMGASNNIGIKKSKTQYVYILNPDTTLKENTLENIFKSVKNLSDFAILSPLHSKLDYPNYKIDSSSENLDNDIIDVKSIDGFSMVINKNKFKEDNFFDENFFLFLENDDLCLRVKNNNQKIYIIKNALVEHLGGSSTNIDKNEEIEYLRSWHWMWSKFYFNKKHYGYLNAIFKILLNFLSAQFKYIYYLITLNHYKRKIYQMRILGLINAILGKSSFLRLPD